MLEVKYLMEKKKKKNLGSVWIELILLKLKIENTVVK